MIGIEGKLNQTVLKYVFIPLSQRNGFLFMEFLRIFKYISLLRHFQKNDFYFLWLISEISLHYSVVKIHSIPKFVDEIF